MDMFRSYVKLPESKDTFAASGANKPGSSTMKIVKNIRVDSRGGEAIIHQGQLR